MTNRKKLTKITLEHRRPAKGRLEIRDSDSPLVLRITAAGARTFSVRTRLQGSAHPLRVTYDKSVCIDNLHDARQWAHRIVDACKTGTDPRPNEATTDAAQKRAKAMMFENVMKNYLERRVRGEKGNRTADETERLLNTYCLPRWRGVRVDQIERSDINALLDDIFDGKVVVAGKTKTYGGKVIADRVLAQLRAMLNWEASRNGRFTPPIGKGMARTKPSDRVRERVLSDEEIRALWTATAQGASTGEKTFNGIVRTLLLTAQRREEVAAMARSEIDASGVWTIPEERYKTKKPNIVPLSKVAVAVIAGQDQIDGARYVFTTNGKTPFSGFSKAKAALDAAMLKALGRESFEKGDWRIHDLRRTARTLMSKAKVRPDIAECVLGHTLKGVEGTYNQDDMAEFKKEALETLAAAVERIVNPPADNVVALRVAAE